MCSNESSIKIIWCVFKDQENSLLYIEYIVKLDQVLIICLLQEFNLSQCEKWYTVSVLYKAD